MERNTPPINTMGNKRLGFTMAAGRVAIVAILVWADLCLVAPGNSGVQAQSQPVYSLATFSVGASPAAGKIADLDGDGLNDIAVVDSERNIQLFFNSGGGSFDRMTLTGVGPTGSSLRDLDIGDLNGDGRNDIAVAASVQEGAVSVVLNNGHRAFAPAINYNSCSFSTGVAIGDIDRDGDRDIVEIGQCSTATALINDGSGRFAPGATYGGSGPGSRSVTLVDLNHDGLNDIAGVNWASGDLTISINNGGASFGAPLGYLLWEMPDDLTTGDFNGDGTMDIAIAYSYYSLIYILLGGQDTLFAGYSEFGGGDTPISIVSSDLDNDGRLDLAVSSGSNSVSVFLNLGYDFARPTTFSVGQFPIDIAAGDLDGDGKSDLVTVNQGSGSITVLFSASDAAPPPPPPPPPPPVITLSVSTRRTTRARIVDLRWSGATTSSVDIYRNGSRLTTTSNDGSFSDEFSTRAKGTFSYKVCLPGSQTCSQQVSVSF